MHYAYSIIKKITKIKFLIKLIAEFYIILCKIYKIINKKVKINNISLKDKNFMIKPIYNT